MSLDLIFVCGALLCILAIPALVSAWVDGRVPSASAFALVSGIALGAYAWVSDPQRYTFSEVPHVFIRVLAEVLRAI